MTDARRKTFLRCLRDRIEANGPGVGQSAETCGCMRTTETMIRHAVLVHGVDETTLMEWIASAAVT